MSVKSIVRERTLGTIRILLALPHTRGEVYLGKLLGRTAVFVVAVLVGYLPAFVILAVGVSGFSMGPFIGGFFVTLFFGFIFLVIGFCASAWMKSEASALVVGFVIFVLMYGWDSIFFAINDGLGLFRGNAETFMARFELIVIGEDIANALTSLWDSDVSSASQAVSNGSDVPFYLQHWFAFVLLAIWIVGPLALGYWKFNRAEL